MIESFGTVPYKLGTTTYELTNIVAAVVLKRMTIDRTFLFQEVIVPQNSTPEMISNNFYGTTAFWHVVCLVNNIVNPWDDLPVDYDLVVKSTRKRFGDENSIRWFIDSRTGRICDDRSTLKWREDYANNSLPEYIHPVSEMQHAQDRNEKLSRLRIVNPNYIHVFDEILRETIG